MITKLVWAVAVIAGATRMFGEKAFMLGLIEAVMILIAAFVALKTVDLILPQKKTEEDSRKKRPVGHARCRHQGPTGIKERLCSREFRGGASKSIVVVACFMR
jgi:hypothetical protein